MVGLPERNKPEKFFSTEQNSPRGGPWGGLESSLGVPQEMSDYIIHGTHLSMIVILLSGRYLRSMEGTAVIGSGKINRMSA